jgi:hypothetical protein
MKRNLFLVSIIFILISSSCFSQTRGGAWKRDRSKIVLGIGATNFLGELGGANKIGSNSFSLRDFDFPSIRPCLGVGYLYVLNRFIDIKTNLNFAYIGGADKLTKEPFRENRNLAFRSLVIELQTQAEFFLTFSRSGHRYNLSGVKGISAYAFSPYVFVGIGGFYFNPKAKYEGKWYSLRKLHTEGQGMIPTRKNYSPVQLCIPFGLGLRYKVNRQWTVGIEFGVRLTFTDYMDDVSTTYVDPEALKDAYGDVAKELANPSPTKDDPSSPYYRSTLAGQQRGDPTRNDSYMFGLVHVYYTLNQGFLPKLKF